MGRIGPPKSRTLGFRRAKDGCEETIDATLNRVSASGVNGGSYFTGSAGELLLEALCAQSCFEVKSIKRDTSGRYLAVAQCLGWRRALL